MRWACPALAVAAAAAGPASTQPASTPASGDDPALTAKLERHVAEVRFDATKFSDAIARLHDLSGAGIDVRWDPVGKATTVSPDEPVTYSATDRPLNAVLADVLDRADQGNGTLEAGVIGHEVVVTTPGDLRRLRAGLDRHRAAHEPPAISHMVLGKGRGAVLYLTDVVTLLTTQSGVDVNPDWDALKAAGTTRMSEVRLPAAALPLGVAVGLLIDPLGDAEHRLDYRVEPDGSVTISTAAALAIAVGKPGPTTR